MIFGMASKGLGLFMVAAPVLAIALIGYNARRQVQTFQVQGYPQEQNAKISAFIEPIRETRAALYSRTSILPAAKRWYRYFAKGQLGDLPRFLVDDDFSRGVKAQILAVRNDIYMRTLEEGNLELKRGNLSKACDHFAASFEVASTLKYSELDTIRESAARQFTALNRIKLAIKRVPPEARAALTYRLVSLLPTKAQAKRWARLAEREVLVSSEPQSQLVKIRTVATEIIAEAKTKAPGSELNASNTLRELAVVNVWESRVSSEVVRLLLIAW